MKYLEGLLISVNYADILSWTLPYNKHLFNKVLVVTDSKDDDTKRVCDHNKVEYLVTDSFYEDGASFNKGKAINEGIRKLSRKDWMLIHDADIALPSNMRWCLDALDLDPLKIYTAARNSCEHGVQFFIDPKPKSASKCLLYPRWIERNKPDVVPLGYFQLFNAKKLPENIYDETLKDAGKSDIRFSELWKKNDRVMLKCFGVADVHCHHGKNWTGRKTERVPFRP